MNAKYLYLFCLLLCSLIQHDIAEAIDTSQPILKTHYYNDFDKNPLITENAIRKITPFLLPVDHETKPVLDVIFSQGRVTENLSTLQDAGFSILYYQPRSFIVVASHKRLPGYLLKLYVDSESRLKSQIPAWRWFVRRCKGAADIRRVIKNKGIKHFTAPKKWIYPLPATPRNCSNENIVVLVVQDMQLVSKKKNLLAWSTMITPNHLEELYDIISVAKGSSYRPDNISLTKSGKFAFIDTEYPKAIPDFESIKKYLSPKMKKYWDNLLKYSARR